MILLMIFLGVGALNSQNNLLFMVFGLLVASAVASGVLSGAMMMGLTAERIPPGPGSVAQPLVLRYRISNTNRLLPAFAVTVLESPTRRGASSGWERLVRPFKGFVAQIPAGGSVDVLVTTTPLRRGIADLVGVRLESGFPFGMVRKSIDVPSPAVLMVHPRHNRLRRDVSTNLGTRTDTDGSATKQGRGDAFYGVREYVPGDSQRLIAWRPSARTGTLVVRENAVRSGGETWIILNLGPPSPPELRADDEAAENAVSLALSLIEMGLLVGKEVGLLVPGHGVVLEPERGSRHRQMMLAALSRLELSEPDRGRKDVPNPLSVVSPRAGCIVVHAGQIDPTLGPVGARHVTAADFDSLVIPAPPAQGADRSPAARADHGGRA